MGGFVEGHAGRLFGQEGSQPGGDVGDVGVDVALFDEHPSGHALRCPHGEERPGRLGPDRRDAGQH